MSTYYTPLRYPGGKAKLSKYIKHVFRYNGLCDGEYVEPYAGGAGVALDLLMTDHASRIHLNDLNFPLYAFWMTVLYDTDRLVRRIRTCRITVATWRRQRSILRDYQNHDQFDVAFAFFFLNRTNRSGILNGGVIGGLEQKGEWLIDARFNRQALIERIERIASFKNRITLYNLDARAFICDVVGTLPSKALIYLDPPYYMKGQRLYDNHYKHDDHASIACMVQSGISQPWLTSYDNATPIKDLYKNRRQQIFRLNYSAAGASLASEVMIYSDNIKIPSVEEKMFNIAPQAQPAHQPDIDEESPKIAFSRHCKLKTTSAPKA